MPRQFGLKATPMAASAPAACKTTLGLIGWMFAPKNRVSRGAAAVRRSSSYTALPYAPASWRGSRGRRSVSVN
ncbi:hypothetical protein [Tardiphaga sp. 709]|uniref:hypothetical protein n=1 Tax=Tardiphaga sp. 709 TaxID=3076039 RepID=UPI0028EF0AA0|nr:hypothetical protein [Tardiphaga sp. 709]WNV08777.1 hypothetical protein RSO67_25380 [Tardiphaga sp. 709]